MHLTIRARIRGFTLLVWVILVFGLTAIMTFSSTALSQVSLKGDNVTIRFGLLPGENIRSKRTVSQLQDCFLYDIRV